MKELILSWVDPEYEGYLRPWPELRYESDEVALIIHSDEQYVPWKAACSEHAPLKVSVLNHALDPPKEIAVVFEFESLVHVKLWMKNFLKKHAQYVPKHMGKSDDNKKSIP
jgi:hypothetical protein